MQQAGNQGKSKQNGMECKWVVILLLWYNSAYASFKWLNINPILIYLYAHVLLCHFEIRIKPA